MRHLSAFAFLALGLTVTVTAAGAEHLRANYQVNVQEGTDLKRVQAASDVTSGTPIEYALPKYKLFLLIDVGQSSTYVLTVSLAALESPEDILVKGTFNGSLVGANAGPLEFAVEQNGVKVSGAISLSSVVR